MPYTAVMIVINDKQYYGVGEAAKKVGVHRDTLRRWIREANIKGFSIGASTKKLYLLEDLRRIIQK